MLFLRYYTNLKFTMQGAGYPAEHLNTVAFVIGILESAYDRLSCTYEFGKLFLRKFCLFAKLVYLGGYVGLLTCFFKGFKPLLRIKISCP